MSLLLFIELLLDKYFESQYSQAYVVIFHSKVTKLPSPCIPDCVFLFTYAFLEGLYFTYRS